MIEIADVFRRFAADYLEAHGASMLPSHRRAIADILDCRTAALGGQVWRCDACDAEMFSYHSCGNRSCPKCHTAQTREWLEHRQAETAAGAVLPHHRHRAGRVARGAAGPSARRLRRADAGHRRRDHRDSPAIRASSAAPSPCSPCCTPGTQRLDLHPHVHCLVSGGGISDGRLHLASGAPQASCCRSRRSPARCAASSGRCCAGDAPTSSSPTRSWRTRLDRSTSPPGAHGEQAVLDYLARYVFRIAHHQRPHRRPRRRQRSPSRYQQPQDRPRSAPAASAATSSCAASFSTCCRAASTRCATSACGIPPTARTPLGCARCCSSRRHPRLPVTAACPPVTRAVWRSANATDRATHLSALSSRAVDLHPHGLAAHAATSHGTMIGNVSLRRHRPVLPLRASTCHAYRRSPTRPAAPTSLQRTLPIAPIPPLQTALLRSYHAGRTG